MNSAIFDFFTENQVKHISIDDLSLIEANTVIYEYVDAGVKSHPSDKGMLGIAKRVAEFFR